MSRFFVGQRVRLVKIPSADNPHGCEVGNEGTVADPATDDRGYFRVTMDRVGVPKWGDPELFEPILCQKHEACDEEFKRDLDKLLEGLPA